MSKAKTAFDTPLSVTAIILKTAIIKVLAKGYVSEDADNTLSLDCGCKVTLIGYPEFVLSPAVGAVLMSVSTIVVALNASLLKLNKK